MSFVSRSGAKSSSEKPRYDLIERSFLRRLAERMGYGAEKHGERNYRLGAHDADYRRDRINHLIEHAFKYAEGDTSTDHLAAIAANCNILAWFEEQPKPGVSLPTSGDDVCECGACQMFHEAICVAQGDGDHG